MAQFPGATWRGPIPNEVHGGMRRPIRGLVLHIEQGTEAGTDSFFHNPGAQASAHFGNDTVATPLDQWVDTNDEAWAEMTGNSQWVSVEHAGHSGDSLTSAQIEKDAQLLAWLHLTEGIPLQLSDSPTTPGLGYHAMGGQAWGGHLQCPGAPIIAQRPQILARAIQIATPIMEAQMYYTDPTSGAVIATDADGNFFAENIFYSGGGGVCTLGQHPDWKAGNTESSGTNPCVGITAWRDTAGAWGYCYITKPASGKGGFGPYDLYHITRNGTPN